MSDYTRKIHDGSQWDNVLGSYILESGTWKEIEATHILKNGSWKRIDFDYYVDSSGSDSDSGLNPDTAFATLGKSETEINNLGDGARLAIKEGSSFDTSDGILTLDNSDVFIDSYDSDSLVFVDLSEELPSGNWALSSGQSNTYEQTVSPVTDTVPTVRIFEDDTQLGSRSSISDVESTPGTFYSDQSGDPWVIYYHPSDSSNPTSNGRVVEWTAQPHFMKSASNVVSKGGSVENIHVRRPLSRDGGIRMGSGGRIERCLLEEGGKHHALHEGGVIKDTIATGDTKRSALTATALVYFHGSGIDQTQDQELIRYGCDAGNTNPMFGHNTNGAGFNDSISKGNWRWDTDRPGDIAGAPTVEGDYLYRSGGLQRGTKSGGVYEGVITDDFGGSSSDDKVEYGITIRDSVILDSLIMREAASAGQNITLENCVIFSISKSIFRDVNSFGGHTITLNNCIISVYANGIIGSASDFTYEGSNNLFFYGDPAVETYIDNNERSLSGLQSTYTSLTNNAWLTHDQWRALYSEEAWRKGDFRISGSPQVTHADGTVSSTLPDGTAISAIGPQRHYDIANLDFADGAPEQFPTPPRSKTEFKTYIQNPDGWNWFDTPIVTHSTDKTIPLISYWSMSGSSGSDEPDQVGSNDLVQTGGVGGGTDGWSYRSFDGNDDYMQVDTNSGINDADRFWMAMPVRFQSINDRRRVFSFGAGSIEFEGSNALSVNLKVYLTSDLAVTPFGSINTGTWYIMQLWYSSARARYGVRLDTLEQEENTIYKSYLDDRGEDRFTLGSRFSGGFNGQIDIGPVMVAEIGPTQADRDWLYNSGSYRTLSEIQNYTITELEI